VNRKKVIANLGSLLNLVQKKIISPVLNNVFGHLVDSKFVIIGHARTGSNYLLDGLMSSKSVAAYHEIFADHNRKIGENFGEVLSQLYRKEGRNVEIVGFKLFYNHLTEDEWQKFLSHKEFKVIHLTRENRLRTIVSLDIAFKTDEWTRSSYVRRRQLTDKRVSLDTHNLIQRLENIRQFESQTRSRFKDRPVFEVVYEDMIRNPHTVFQNVGEFLGIGGIDFTKIKIVKQNPERLEQLIINFDEVSHLLKDSRFANCLYE